MSVYKSPKSPYYQYDFSYQGDRFHGSTGVETLAKARAVERKKRDDAALGLIGKTAGASAYTLDQAAGRWWDEVGEGRKDSRSVEYRLRQLLTLIDKSTSIGAIDTAEVAAAIERRRGLTFRRSKAKGARQYLPSNATVNRDVIETLRPILKRAQTHWMKAGEPALPIIGWRELRMREPREIVRTYSPSERQAWLDECDDMARLALDMLLTYGMRYGELFFRLDAYEPSGPRLEWMKGRKGDIPHTVPLLERHSREIAARIGRAAAAKHLRHIWFVEEVDAKGRIALREVTYGGLEARISSAAKRAKIKPGRIIHGARHHAGTAILKATKNIKTAQRLLGHANIASTARYLHAMEDDVRDGLDAIEKADQNRDIPGSGVDEVTKTG